MKRFLLLTAMMLVTAGSAWAVSPGVNLNWTTDCYSDNAVTLKTFACNTNTGTAPMTASFALTADQPSHVGTSGIVDLQADAATLPDWWTVNYTGSCRGNVLTASADFTSVSTAVNCVDAYVGNATGGITAYKTQVNTGGVPEVFVPNRARIKYAFAVPADAPVPLTAGTEYFSARLQFSYLKSTGTGSCAGCATGVTIVLNEIQSAENTVGSVPEILTAAIANNCINWQNANVSCGAVPVRNRSWGEIKSLYR